MVQAEKANTTRSKKSIYNRVAFHIKSWWPNCFCPADGYLYLMMGDGGSQADPYNFAQNKKSVLGKVIRVGIDTIPSESWQ